MTLVHFHLTDAEGRGLDGSVSLVPTRRVTVADAIRLPVAQTVRLTAGEATAEVMPSTTQWAWRASELVAGGIVRYVEVPDKESAEYSGLADVDPKTLDQSSETVAAWELVTRAAQGVLDRNRHDRRQGAVRRGFGRCGEGVGNGGQPGKREGRRCGRQGAILPVRGGQKRTGGARVGDHGQWSDRRGEDHRRSAHRNRRTGQAGCGHGIPGGADRHRQGRCRRYRPG